MHTIIWNSASSPTSGMVLIATRHEWAQDIHANQAPLIAQHRNVPRSLRLWWGAIRNLLCGVTTVCHHNPITQELVNPGFPVRVVSEFAWAHSPSFEPLLAGKFATSRADLPFILHAAEGIDQESAQEIFALDRMHALDERTVLVHGAIRRAVAVLLLRSVHAGHPRSAAGRRRSPRRRWRAGTGGRRPARPRAGPGRGRRDAGCGPRRPAA